MDVALCEDDDEMEVYEEEEDDEQDTWSCVRLRLRQGWLDEPSVPFSTGRDRRAPNRFVAAPASSGRSPMKKKQQPFVSGRRSGASNWGNYNDKKRKNMKVRIRLVSNAVEQADDVEDDVEDEVEVEDDVGDLRARLRRLVDLVGRTESDTAASLSNLSTPLQKASVVEPDPQPVVNPVPPLVPQPIEASSTSPLLNNLVKDAMLPSFGREDFETESLRRAFELASGDSFNDHPFLVARPEPVFQAGTSLVDSPAEFAPYTAFTIGERRQGSQPLGASVVTLRDRLGSSVQGEPLKMSIYPGSPPPLMWTVETADRLLWAQGERGEFSPTLRPSALESRLGRLSVAELDRALRTLGVPGRSLGGKFRRVALLISIAVNFSVAANEKECTVLNAKAVDLIHDMLFPKPAPAAAAVGPAAAPAVEAAPDPVDVLRNAKKNAPKRLPRTDASSVYYTADDEVQISNSSLIDPLSLKKLELPGRSSNCKHSACFDVGHFLEMNRDDVVHLQTCHTWGHKFSCPICNVTFLVDDLYVDSDTVDLLARDAAAQAQAHVPLVETGSEAAPFVLE